MLKLQKNDLEIQIIKSDKLNYKPSNVGFVHG
jgi:hypothetical protein